MTKLDRGDSGNTRRAIRNCDSIRSSLARLGAVAGAVVACWLPMACGDGGETGAGTTATATTAGATANTPEDPGPLAAVCDAALASGVRPRAESPRGSGTERLSRCDIRARGVRIVLGLDSAADAAQRFSNRIVEAAQFSSLDHELAPQPVRGVGDPARGPDGADWLPAFHQLLSVRGERLLIAEVTGDDLPDARGRQMAIDLSREVWRRLHAARQGSPG